MKRKQQSCNETLGVPLDKITTTWGPGLTMRAPLADGSVAIT